MLYSRRRPSHIAVLILAVAGQLAWAVTAGAAGPAVRPVSKLTMHDAHGKRMGDVLDTLGAPSEPRGFMIALEINRRIYTLYVPADMVRFVGVTSAGIVSYESTDCTGTPWVRAPEGAAGHFLNPNVPYWAPPLPHFAIGRPGQTIYVADPEPIVQEREMRSYRADVPGGCFTLPPSNSQDLVVPTAPVVNLDQVFTAPFTVR